MAVTDLTTAVQTPLSVVPVPVTAGALQIAWQVPSVAAEGVQFTPAGNELILVRNAAASPGTITIASAQDEYGRKGDITTYSIPAQTGAIAGNVICLPLKSAKLFTGGTTAGKIVITMSAVTIEVAVLKMPFGF